MGGYWRTACAFITRPTSSRARQPRNAITLAIRYAMLTAVAAALAAGALCFAAERRIKPE